MLGDLVKDEEKEKRRIRLALSCGAGTLFYKIYARSNGMPLKTDIREFEINLEDYGFSTEFIDEVLNSFLYAISYQELNNSVPSEKISSMKEQQKNSRKSDEA